MVWKNGFKSFFAKRKQRELLLFIKRLTLSIKRRDVIYKTT
jgi:hypothetical protein